MYRNKHIGLVMAIALGVACFGMFRVAVADTDLYYQSLTNLGPYASSRVLLMNNDMNSLCPIRGQGYHDTIDKAKEGETYWWHDDVPVKGEAAPGIEVKSLMNLQTGVNHILYQKRGAGEPPVKLWELINCRAGSAASQRTSLFNYLPWSSTCEPIDPEIYSSNPPNIPNTFVPDDSSSSNGIKQVAVVSMRASLDAAIYSPLYDDGIGEIYFDCVNLTALALNSEFVVEIATDVLPNNKLDFFSETNVNRFVWRKVPCEVFTISKSDAFLVKDEKNDGKEDIKPSMTAGWEVQMHYRVRILLNQYGQIRFRKTYCPCCRRMGMLAQS